MPRARRSALLGGGLSAYVDLNFAAGKFKAGPAASGDLTALAGFAFTRASAATFFGSNGLLQTAASGSPRFAYDPLTLVALGILVEEARTNFVLQSNAPTAGTGTTVTAAAAASPDGTTNAVRVAKTDATTPRYLSMTTSMTVAAATSYTVSVFAKYDGFDTTISLEYNNAANWGAVSWLANFTIASTGVTTGSVANCTSAVVSVGNGWYRCSATFTTGGTVSTPSNPFILSRITGASGVSALTAFYQLEAGPAASSYIATTASAVTRPADVPTLTAALAYPLTIVTEFRRSWDAGAEQIVAQVDAGSDAQRSYASIDGSDLFAGTTSGSGASTVAGATAAGTSYKGAVRIATNDLQTALGGVLGTADTSATNPTDPTRIVIGGANAAGSPLNGTISRIRIYNRALTDGQLRSITA